MMQRTYTAAAYFLMSVSEAEVARCCQVSASDVIMMHCNSWKLKGMRPRKCVQMLGLTLAMVDPERDSDYIYVA